MRIAFEAESTLTDRYQTTVPEPVRTALRLGKRDKIHYRIRPSGEVVLTRGEDGGDDPVVEEFLKFLARDMQANPALVRPVTKSLIERGRALTAGVKVDRDAALTPDDE